MAHGFQKIGTLGKAAVNTLANRASIPSPSRTLPTSSATIGEAAVARKPSRSIGTPPGALGSAITSPATAEDLGRAMAGDDPLVTDRIVQALLPPRVRSSLTPRYRYPKTDPSSGYVVAFAMSGDVSPADAGRALAFVRQAQQPASLNEIMLLLARLKSMTVSGPQGAEDMKAQFAFYAEELLRYPADAVRHVLRTQPRVSKFWPAWCEIAERLEDATRERRRLQALLLHQSGSVARSQPTDSKR